MSLKKKIIFIVFVISLIVAIIVPRESFSLENVPSMLAAKLLEFVIISTCALCWVGAPAGWNLARENGLRELGMLIFAFLGIYVSVLVALYQLISKEEH